MEPENTLLKMKITSFILISPGFYIRGLRDEKDLGNACKCFILSKAKRILHLCCWYFCVGCF